MKEMKRKKNRKAQSDTEIKMRPQKSGIPKRAEHHNHTLKHTNNYSMGSKGNNDSPTNVEKTDQCSQIINKVENRKMHIGGF